MPSEARARTAAAHNREQDRILRPTSRLSNSYGRRLARAGTESFAKGTPIMAALMPIWREYATDLGQLGLVSHLTGLRRSALTAAPLVAKRAKAAAGTFDAAVEFATARAGLSKAAANELALEYDAVAVRLTADISAAVETKVALAVAESVSRGTHVREGMALVNAAFKAAGAGSQSAFALETLFRTQTQLAYSAGRMIENRDPFIDELIWGYEYVATMDDRTRPNHAVLHGTRYAKDDPRLGALTPPLGYNCRCEMIEIFTTDAPREQETVNPPPEGVPDEGWAFDPTALFSDTTAKLPKGISGQIA